MISQLPSVVMDSRFRRTALLLFVTACGGSGPNGLDLIREDQLRTDLGFLAADRFRGRETGTVDELAASAWLAEQARSAGLEPAGDDGTYFQFWPLKQVRSSPSTLVKLGSTKLGLATDVQPLSLRTAVVDAPIVMAGDGTPGALAGLDLRDKAVVIEMTKPSARFPDKVSLRPVRYVAANYILRTPAIAEKRPAIIVMVSDAVADSAWDYIAAMKASYGLEFSESLLGPVPPVPVIWVRRRMLPLLAVRGQRLTAFLAVERVVVPSVNVVARVRGTDPMLRDQYVLFSAHQDHEGVREPIAGDSIWNGADDNGSGSVGILAIGRAWARRPARRSALFVWHGAEEKGMIGSQYHALHPMVPKESIVAVLNADMIGGNGADSAGLLGVQPPHLNSPELAEIVLRANELVGRFTIDTSWDNPAQSESWYYRSDHLPYVRIGVPAVFFSSLADNLYHTPLDDPSRINYPKLAQMARWIYAAGWAVANRDERVKLLPGFQLTR